MAQRSLRPRRLSGRSTLNPRHDGISPGGVHLRESLEQRAHTMRIDAIRSASRSDDLSADGFPPRNHKGEAPAFSRCYVRVPLVDKLGGSVPIDFECSMSCGFFKVKKDWICYRRNYISVGAELVHPTYQSVYVDDPERHAVRHFAFVISAVTAADPPCPIEMVQHTPKRDKGPQHKPQFIPLESPLYRANWHRLQYKTATGNNGKKRGQQYFSIKITLLAWLESTSPAMHNKWIEIADKFSEPMIVRGRSPGHYHDIEEQDDSCSDVVDVSVDTSRSETQLRRSSDTMSDVSTTRPSLFVPMHYAEQPEYCPTPHPDHGHRYSEPSLPYRNVPWIDDIPRSTTNNGVSSWTDNQDNHLAPLLNEACQHAPRLPTYDQVMVQKGSDSLISSSSSSLSLDAVHSPEIEAALSLASIRGGLSSPTSMPESLDNPVQKAIKRRIKPTDSPRPVRKSARLR